MSKRRRHLSKTGKLIVGILIVVLVAITVGVVAMLIGNSKSSEHEAINITMPSVEPTSQTVDLASIYDPIYEEYSAINEDYIAYLEWENDLLYDYVEDSVDKYPHVIVRSKIVDTGEGNVNDANNEYMRHDITHEEKSFGQDFMDGSNQLDENGLPIDQNIIIYGHYVYNEAYKETNLKFTPLETLIDSSVYDDYDTFTLTFNGQQRTYQVAHVYHYDKSLYNGNRQESPFAVNFTEQELADYLADIETIYGDYLDTGVEIGPNDNFVTLQTCVYEDDSRLFLVVAKEISRVDF